MKLSHSKLSLILDCPMSYYLNYREGIKLKDEKNAFAIGSAVHWGIEHNTEDLTEYFKEKSNKIFSDYGRDELLAESMVHGYLKYKDEIFDELLKDLEEPDKKLELLEEIHELEITAPLKSYSNPDNPHEFLGIIDLLLLTNKGFIIVDYKTSSQTPDFDKYLEQIYRYIFLLKSEFPDTPVYKIGIVNIKKSQIRQKKDENEESFLLRLKREYNINEDLINSHIFLQSDLNPQLIEDYIDNLSKEADMAALIDTNNLFYINYQYAKGILYGKSDYYNIIYNTPDAYLLYKIKDFAINEDDEIVQERDCRPIDMLVIKHKNVLNHFEKFLSLYENYKADGYFVEFLRDNYIVDDYLLDQYFKLLERV